MVDQLKAAAMKINKQNDVKGCVLLLVVCFNYVKGFLDSFGDIFLHAVLIFDIIFALS